MFRSLLPLFAAFALSLSAAPPPAQGKAPAPAQGHAASRHQANGVGCADCHGKAKKKTAVAAEKCLECHGPATELAKKTAAVKPENPHDSPHWGPGMDCTVCHRQHEATVNWCNHCHAFGFKVP